MKKQVLSILLCMAMAVPMLIGCSSDSSAQKDIAKKTSNDSKKETEVESVETRTVYVTPQWVNSARNGEQEGYDNISLYDGGWYEWLMHEDYPVQVGDPASDDCVHTTVGELPTGKAAQY